MADDLPRALCEAIADDIETLILLQDSELDAAKLLALRRLGFPDNLGLLPSSERARGSYDLMREAVAALPPDPGEDLVDRLAADYADIFLNGSLGASPMESVWLSDDHTACHEPMFDLRKIYAARGLQAADWRRRPDDHLLLQLHFVAHCLRDVTVRAVELADFLDRHLLRWIDDFSARVAARCDTQIYAALVLLDAALIDALRDILAQAVGQPRPSREEVEARCRPQCDLRAAPLRFFPGGGPGW